MLTLNKKKLKLFPWIETVWKSFLKSFPRDYDNETLNYFHLSVKNEIKSLSSNTNKSEALYSILREYYNHFCWKIKRYKDCSMKISCSVILSDLIKVCLFLSDGNTDSEWVSRICTAIHLFPGGKNLLYDALLHLSRLKKKYQEAYAVIVEHILSTSDIEAANPMIYFQIILLFRRLKRIANDKYKKAYFLSMAAGIQPPKNLECFLKSNGFEDVSEINFKAPAKQFMGNQFSSEVFLKLREVVYIVKEFDEKEEDDDIKEVDSAIDNSQDFIIDACGSQDRNSESSKLMKRKIDSPSMVESKRIRYKHGESSEFFDANKSTSITVDGKKQCFIPTKSNELSSNNLLLVDTIADTTDSDPLFHIDTMPINKVLKQTVIEAPMKADEQIINESNVNIDIIIPNSYCSHISPMESSLKEATCGTKNVICNDTVINPQCVESNPDVNLNSSTITISLEDAISDSKCNYHDDPNNSLNKTICKEIDEKSNSYNSSLAKDDAKSLDSHKSEICKESPTCEFDIAEVREIIWTDSNDEPKAAETSVRFKEKTGSNEAKSTSILLESDSKNNDVTNKSSISTLVDSVGTSHSLPQNTVSSGLIENNQTLSNIKHNGDELRKMNILNVLNEEPLNSSNRIELAAIKESVRSNIEIIDSHPDKDFIKDAESNQSFKSVDDGITVLTSSESIEVGNLINPNLDCSAIDVLKNNDDNLFAEKIHKEAAMAEIEHVACTTSDVPEAKHKAIGNSLERQSLQPFKINECQVVIPKLPDCFISYTKNLHFEENITPQEDSNHIENENNEFEIIHIKNKEKSILPTSEWVAATDLSDSVAKMKTSIMTRRMHKLTENPILGKSKKSLSFSEISNGSYNGVSSEFQTHEGVKFIAYRDDKLSLCDNISEGTLSEITTNDNLNDTLSISDTSLENSDIEGDEMNPEDSDKCSNNNDDNSLNNPTPRNVSPNVLDSLVNSDTQDPKSDDSTESLVNKNSYNDSEITNIHSISGKFSNAESVCNVVENSNIDLTDSSSKFSCDDISAKNKTSACLTSQQDLSVNGPSFIRRSARQIQKQNKSYNIKNNPSKSISEKDDSTKKNRVLNQMKDTTSSKLQTKKPSNTSTPCKSSSRTMLIDFIEEKEVVEKVKKISPKQKRGNISSTVDIKQANTKSTFKTDTPSQVDTGAVQRTLRRSSRRIGKDRSSELPFDISKLNLDVSTCKKPKLAPSNAKVFSNKQTEHNSSNASKSSRSKICQEPNENTETYNLRPRRSIIRPGILNV